MKNKLLFLPVIVACGFLISCSKSNELHNWWSKKETPDTLYRNSPIGFALAGKMYLGLGYNSKLLTDWSAYDVNRGTWARKADFPGTPRINAFYTSDEQYGYVGMGFTTDFSSAPWTLTPDIWQYDPAKDTWTQLTTAPFASTLYTPSSFVVDGKLFVAHDKELWAFDLTSKSWQRKNDVPFTGIIKSIFDESRKALVTSGEVFFLFNESTDPQSGYPYTAIWRYYPATDAWTTIKSNMFTGNVDCEGAFAVSGTIYMASDFEVWYSVNVTGQAPDLKHVAYLDLKSFPSSGVAAAVGNSGYVFFSSREFWKYIP